MNLVKKFLVKKRTKGRVETFGKIKALIEVSSLLILNFLIVFWPASSSYSLIKLTKKLTQRLRQVRDLKAIAIKI